MDSLPGVIVQASVRDIGRSVVATEMEKMSSIVKAEISHFHGACEATEGRRLLKQKAFMAELLNGSSRRQARDTAAKHYCLFRRTRLHDDSIRRTCERFIRARLFLA